jgi:hypothetical protein
MAEGTSAGRFDITPANTVTYGSDAGGTFYTQFKDDYSHQLDPNATTGWKRVYVQFQARWTPGYLTANWAGGEGWKILAWSGGNINNTQNIDSCNTPTLITSNAGYLGFPHIYNSCTGSASHGPYAAIGQTVAPTYISPSGTDRLMQDARPKPYCLYSMSNAMFYPNDINFFPPNGNCFPFFASEWVTVLEEIILGPRGSADGTVSLASIRYDFNNTPATPTGSFSNLSCDTTVDGNLGVGHGSGANFNVTWSGNQYALGSAAHGTSIGSGYYSGNLCTIKGTQLGGASPANDLTLQISLEGNAGVVGRQPLDEAVNSWVRLWMARQGSPYYQPIWNAGPFNYSIGVCNAKGAMASPPGTDCQSLGKFFLIPHNTGRNGSDSASQTTQSYWVDSLILSDESIPVPNLSPPPPSATLTFTVQPSNTASGSTMIPAVQVTDSDSTYNGTMTLNISGCGAGVANNTVTASSGLAMWSTLSMTGSGTGCTFTVTATGANNAVSNTFNVTGGSTTLTFTQQPTTTVQGNTMTPPVIVTNSNSSFTGNISLAISGCGAGATNTTAAASGGAATFSALGMTGAGVGCTFTASATGATNAVSNPFDVSVVAYQAHRSRLGLTK